MELISLSKLKILHLHVLELFSSKHKVSENCFKLKHSLQNNFVLEEMSLIIREVHTTTCAEFFTSIIEGMAMNTKVKSFVIKIGEISYDTSKAVVCLLKENYTLKALKLTIYFPYQKISESIPSALEVNTPLNSLSIRHNSVLEDLIIRNCKSLQCLECDHPLQCSVPKLFQCHPCLQQLALRLHTTDSVIELFTILKSNTTLTALQVEIENSKNILADDNVGVSLQDMIKENRKIQYLELNRALGLYRSEDYIPSAYLPYLTAGLEHNSTLQGLSIPLLLSNKCADQITNFFGVTSNKKNLTELNLDLFCDQCDKQSTDEETAHTSDRHSFEEELTKLYISLILPLIINLLKKNIRMKLFQITFISFSKKIPGKKKTPTALELMWTACLHPSLEHFGAPKLLSDDEEEKVMTEAFRIRGNKMPSVCEDYYI